MILVLIILIPFIAGILAWISGRRNSMSPRWISLTALSVDLVLALLLLARNPDTAIIKSVLPEIGKRWHSAFYADWLPAIGAGFHLAADGISLILILMTCLLGIMAVTCAWTEIRERVGFFHFNLLWCLTGVMAVFLAADLFLFYFFWELMLVPMYFLIALWGHENRRNASVKFFIFTQLSGLVLLAAILGLYFIHGAETGTYTFDYFQLVGTAVRNPAALFLFLGFLMAFLVKLPAVPFHTWLADAHTEAPTAGSVILAGLLLKTGAYGIFRLAIPLFPTASLYFSGIMMFLAVIGILYGAVMAFSQSDLKRLVAYTSISHMGFVLLGIFAWNEIALQGAVIQIICHGFSTGALFMIVGSLQERIGTRDLEQMGRLWETAPRMGGAALFFALASLGLPGLGNFIGEFLVLLGTYRISIPLTVAASAGFVLSTVYSLRMIRRTFFGERRSGLCPSDLGIRESAAIALLIILLVWIGLYPGPVIRRTANGLDHVMAAKPYRTEYAKTGPITTVQLPEAHDGVP